MSVKKVLGRFVVSLICISVCLMELSILELVHETAKTKLFVSLVVVVKKEKPMFLIVNKNIFMIRYFDHCCIF